MNKIVMLFLLLTYITCLQAPPRVEFLKRSSSEGTGPDGRMNRPAQLTINTAKLDIKDSPLSARLDDARTAKEWHVLKILNVINAIKTPLEYDWKRQHYVNSPVSSPLSPDELQRLFPKTIDTFLDNHALALDGANGDCHIYLPGFVKEYDGLCSFGYFNYRFTQQADHYGAARPLCNYRKFNPISADQFPCDDLMLQDLSQDALSSPLCWDCAPVKKVFYNLKLVQQTLAIEQNNSPNAQETTFPTCFLSNLRTLLIGQAKLALTQAPFDVNDISQQLKSYQAQINSSKNALTASVESLRELDTEKETLDQASIIDTARKLQTEALLKVPLRRY